MMTTDKTALKVRIREELTKGSLSIYEIADKLDTSKSTVSLEKVAMEKETDTKAEEAVSSLSPKMVLAMAERMQEESPKMARDLTHLASGLQSMHRLQPELHRAVETVVTRCEKKLQDEDIKPGAFAIYAELILKAYATVNHKGATTQINVQQNNNAVTIEQLKEERQRLLDV